jgi:D-alanyl-D-alanine dipeptidase
VRNAFYNDFYSELGLDEALVHPDLYKNLRQLSPILLKHRLRLVIYDAFRPVNVQRYMYNNAGEVLRPYIAEPPTAENASASHTRAVAIDCFLAREDNIWLEFPTAPDAFYIGWEKDLNFVEYLKRAHRSFMNCPDYIIANRKLLEDLLCGVGLVGEPTEWWHFQLPNFQDYPIIESLDNVEIIR